MAGPDGALWFTNSGNNSIGRVTASRQVTNYTDISISRPQGITAGPDGALWFTNFGNNSIGKITTTGQVTNYPGTGISGPTAITAGPDRALWFINSTGDSIGRITTTGKVTDYSSPSLGRPVGIAAGPDGALWFNNTVFDGGTGRITTTGKFTFYGGGGDPGIAAGPDGAMWSTNSLNGSIGRVTTNVISTSSFAGYQTAVTAGSATSSAATFTVPTLSCKTANTGNFPNAGVGATSTSSLAGVFTGCVKGSAVYFPVLVVNGTETNYTKTPLSAGDVINLSASVTTSGTTVQVTDVTKNVTKKLTGAGASATGAGMGDGAWYVNGTLLGVPKFGTLTFTSCRIDGKALASGSPSGYLRANSAGIVQIAPGALSPAGTAFTTYYDHA